MTCPKEYHLVSRIIREIIKNGKTGYKSPITDFFPDCDQLLKRLQLLKENHCISNFKEFIFIINYEQYNKFNCKKKRYFRHYFAKLAANLFLYYNNNSLNPSQKKEFKLYEKSLNKAIEMEILDQDIYNNYCNEFSYKKRMELQRLAQIEREKLERIKEEKRIKEREKYLQERKALIPFLEPAANIFNQNIISRIAIPLINETDLELVKKWGVFPDNLCLSNILEIDRDFVWELRRLLSARIAEKGAKIFYENYGHTVEDISIKQNDNHSIDWKLYDLKIYSPFLNNTISIDVKNARRAQNSYDRYVNHCVPQFKVTRDNSNVVITGVLSDYLFLDELVSNDSHVIILGETTIERQQKIKKEFEDDYFEITIRNHKNHFLPPWMFDFPPYVYTERNRNIDIIKTLEELEIYLMLCQNDIKEPVNIKPICLATGIDLNQIKEYDAFENDSEWIKELYVELHNKREKFKNDGIELPIIFYTVLKHFLRVMSSEFDQKYEGYKPIKYTDLLMDKNNNEFPVGIYDPLKTITGLIKALDTLWTANHGSIKKYKNFKLVSHNILEGYDRKGNRNRLIAYCGGHLPDGSACGKNPLVLGEKVNGMDTIICEKCGFLICPICNYCYCKKN